jgi:hypothetical protein
MWDQNQSNKQNPGKNDQSRKIFSLRPDHTEHALSHLVLEAKQGWAWLILGWKTDLQKRLLRDKQFGDKGRNAIKVPMESLVPDLSKTTKAERIKEMVLMHVWLFGIKTLLDTNSYFRQSLLLK